MNGDKMDDHGLSEIRWPALSFGAPNCSMMRYDSATTLSLLSVASLRSIAALTEHFVVDSTGTRFDLSDPEFSESISAIRRLTSLLLGSKHNVRWRCSRGSAVEVPELKRLIEKDWRTYETVWQALDLDKLRQRLSKSDTVADVIAVFG